MSLVKDSYKYAEIPRRALRILARVYEDDDAGSFEAQEILDLFRRVNLLLYPEGEYAKADKLFQKLQYQHYDGIYGTSQNKARELKEAEEQAFTLREQLIDKFILDVAKED